MAPFSRLVACALVLSALATASWGQSSRIQADLRHQQLKAEHERRVNEMKRKLGQTAPSHRAAAGLSPSHFTPSGSANRPPTWNPPTPLAGLKLPATRPVPPPFNAEAALPPADCLWKYVAVAKSATSMEQILPYLPTNEAHALQAHQKTYDPQQAAKNRAWHKQQGPSVSEESLTFITNPPYVNALARHKSIAEKILEVLKVKIDGAKATIEVSTTSGAIVDGKEYPYGTASIELEGEGNTWKIGAYNDGNFAYLEPPPPKL